MLSTLVKPFFYFLLLSFFFFFGKRLSAKGGGKRVETKISFKSREADACWLCISFFFGKYQILDNEFQDVNAWSAEMQPCHDFRDDSDFHYE
jgi:hypothetical protein